MVLLPVLFIVCSVSSAQSQCLTAEDDGSKGQAAHQELLRSSLEFSLSLLKGVGNQQPSDNVFISPVSIYNALLLAYFVSRGHTEESLHRFLHLPASQDKLDMLVSYRLQRILTATAAYKSQSVNTANRLFVSVEQTVLGCMYDYFKDEIETLDFNERRLYQAVDRINSWVAQQTNNNIQNMIDPGSINPGTQLILANAAYFKGTWQTQFDERDTRMGSFFISHNKSVSVPMMYLQDTFKHWRSDEVGAEILDLPYKGNNMSLLLLLPDPSNDLYPTVSLLSRLSTSTLQKILRDSIDPKNDDKVEIRLPKFSVERTLELTAILESLGVGDLFRSTSDLTGLTGGPRIRLNSAIHKAKIQVDEKGTEAAAATALTDTRIPGNVFLCDRPFIYLLFDKTSDINRATLLFAGIYNDPTK